MVNRHIGPGRGRVPVKCLLTACCAGGGDSELLLPVERSSIASGSQQLHVGISGLKGGHSGEALHHSRHMFHALTDCDSFHIQC